jgi:hypothetical protein
VNRETIMSALFTRLTSAPMVFGFTADTTTGSNVLTAVSGTTGLMVGMPVMGDGLAADVTIATVTPTVTVSLPAIADRSASTMRQGFQTTRRRWTDPNNEQDMPAMYLFEHSEMHPARSDSSNAIVELHCQLEIYTRVGADPGAVPAAILNALIDGVERALYPSSATRGFLQDLGMLGVRTCRIEGEIIKNPGRGGDQIASAAIPLIVYAAQGGY